MANELAFDLLHGVGNEKDIFKLSYTTNVEQLQEIIKVSMIASEKEPEDAACELIKKPDCAVESTISQGPGIHEPPSVDRKELATKRADRTGCIEQQRIKWDDKGRKRFKGKKPTGRYKSSGKRIGDVPQTSSSSRDKGGHFADTCNTGDHKWKSDSRDGNRSYKKWVDLEHAKSLKGFKR